MSEMPSIESKWGRRLRLSAEAVLIVLGAVLLVGLSFAQTLAWAQSPEGLNQGAFWAWVIVLWLGFVPTALALQARRISGRGIAPDGRSLPHGQCWLLV
jgi:drug/metabolite transporter (DMT)-like permease